MIRPLGGRRGSAAGEYVWMKCDGKFDILMASGQEDVLVMTPSGVRVLF